jgi:hypothetical protein
MLYTLVGVTSIRMRADVGLNASCPNSEGGRAGPRRPRADILLRIILAISLLSWYTATASSARYLIFIML